MIGIDIICISVEQCECSKNPLKDLFVSIGLRLRAIPLTCISREVLTLELEV